MITGPWTSACGDRIVAETHGNPLALLELPRGLSPAELAGGFALPDALPLPSRIEESFRQRVERLPADTQRLLLVAAAEPIGDPTLLWRVADQLGLGAGTAGPAEDADLIDSRRQGHLSPPAPALGDLPRRLSAKTDGACIELWRKRPIPTSIPIAAPGIGPTRRSLPDEDVAAELERSAGPGAGTRRARRRGGVPRAGGEADPGAGAPGPARRSAAAQAKHDAGAPDAALVLLAAAEEGPLDELQRARLERLRAQIAFALRRGSDAPPLLLRAAQRLEPLDASSRAKRTSKRWQRRSSPAA